MTKLLCRLGWHEWSPCRFVCGEYYIHCWRCDKQRFIKPATGGQESGKKKRGQK